MIAGEGRLLAPTFTSFVENSMDGLILFEICLSERLSHVPRRPYDRERSQLINSGNIFIYEEATSGIKPWTDGDAWSPSRILGNFLIYPELEKPFPPGEKKRVIKRKRSILLDGGRSQRGDFDSHENPIETARSIARPEPAVNSKVKHRLPYSDQDKELEHSLIGSLVDKYRFRADGLVRKTMTISINGISYHMVSNYEIDDVKENNLTRPLQDPCLQQFISDPSCMDRGYANAQTRVCPH